MSNEQHKALIAAADFFNETARKLLTTTDGKLHAETLIASVARTAGSLMYRSFDFDKSFEPGTSVLSDQANIHGPKLMNGMFVTLNQLGSKLSENELNSEYMTTKHSQLSYKESTERLAPFFLKYCQITPLGLQEAAFGAAIATAILVHDCRQVLSVDKGAAIAVYGFVEGTKTAPYPTGVEPATPASQSKSPPPAKKPWYKLW